jgi:transcription initiation factor IIE alpha subunit
LANTIGITSVHINRTLQRLRNDQLISLHRQHLTIRNPRRLAELAGFDANYLSVSRHNA